MIEVEDLVKDYGSFRAVDRISFSAGEGEIVGFLGPNGAGKTTTIRVLAGYHAATSGRARVAGFDVLDDSLAARAAVGYLPENVPIYPDLRVEEYLRFRARLKGVPRREVAQRVGEAMELAGVAEMRRRLVGQVSRGYRRRVGLADALVARPPVLILDEPTSGLDPNQRRRLREEILGLEGRHTILFSSHILSDVEAVCDRIVLIHAGRIRADGTLDELVERLGRLCLHVRAAGALPPAGELFADLPAAGTPERREGADGFVEYRLPLDPGAGRDGDRWLDLVAARLGAARIRELTLERPSLEAIFADLTEGRAGGEADAA